MIPYGQHAHTNKAVVTANSSSLILRENRSGYGVTAGVLVSYESTAVSFICARENEHPPAFLLAGGYVLPTLACIQQKVAPRSLMQRGAAPTGARQRQRPRLLSFSTSTSIMELWKKKQQTAPLAQPQSAFALAPNHTRGSSRRALVCSAQR